MSPRQDISEGRQALFYLGSGLQVVGLLLFGSTFVSACSQFGDFTDFDARSKTMFGRAIGGMALLVVGSVVRSAGQRGAAGSGLVLDPQRARRDLEPFSRQAGGMLGDALDEAGLERGGRSRAPSGAAAEPVVKIRCLGCNFLNEEDSKFCQECGRPMRADA